MITPCLNSLSLLEKTVESVRLESAKRETLVIEHLVIDGDSDDGSVEYLNSAGYPHLRLTTEKDRSLYEAVAKGLTLTKGKIVLILGAGDVLMPGSLQRIIDYSKSRPVAWVSGHQNFHQFIPESKSLSRRGPLVFRSLAQSAAYGKFLPAIQQESTFFSRELIGVVSLEKLATFKLAGDNYLWSCFSNYAKHERVNFDVGSFLIHPGQLSENKASYLEESDSIFGPLKKNTQSLFMVSAVLLDAIVSFLVCNGNRQTPVRRWFKRGLAIE